MYADERLVVFGTGKASENVFTWLKEKGVVPVAIVDNNPRTWGKTICGVCVSSPAVLRGLSFDRVLVSSSQYFTEIAAELREKYALAQEHILRPTALLQEELVEFYRQNPALIDSGEKELLLERIRLSGEVLPFNYPFSDEENRAKITVEVGFDESCSLFYAMYKGKRMYMARKFTTAERVIQYVRGIITEQHKNSPHRYLDDDFAFEGGIVLDAGVAEGNFALDVLEAAEKIVLVEADPLWCEALAHTFAPYKEKVHIVNKFLSDSDGKDSVTVDTLLGGGDVFDFIKMDIEGAEMCALHGAEKTLRTSKNMRLAVCAYHRFDDERNIKAFLGSAGFDVRTTQGYMVFPFSSEHPKRFVRGVIRAQKR